MSSITINPMATTNAAGSFSISSTGFIQGTMLDDPAVRNALAGGILAAGQLPLFGGCAITELIPAGISGATGSDVSLGGTLKRSTSVTAPTGGQSALLAVTGFSVFNQNPSAIITPQSPVPAVLPGMTANLFRLGSGARIAVAIDPSLVSEEGHLISTLVSWDFALQRLIPYNAAYPANVVTASSWAATGGGQITLTTTTNHGVAVGSDFTITGETPSGYNGTFTALAGTATNSLVAALAVDPGASTVQGTLVAGGGALACKVLEVDIGHSMTWLYDPVTQLATWNRSGSCAIIQI